MVPVGFTALLSQYLKSFLVDFDKYRDLQACQGGFADFTGFTFVLW